MSRAISSLPEGDEKKTALREIKKEAVSFYKNYDTDIDKELFASMQPRNVLLQRSKKTTRASF